MLRDVSRIACTSTLFGKKTCLPVTLAPIGTMSHFTGGGAVTAAKAAEEFGISQFLGSAGNASLEDVAAAGDHCRIFQLYVRGDNAWVDDHVRRAVDNGYTAFCFTVDTAVISRRERDISKRWRLPGQSVMEGFGYQARLSWDDIKRFKDTYDIPLILKGIATGADAVTACDHGVEVIYVSNHGGRQLDHCRGAMEMLPEIVRAVGNRATIFFDGGCMRGADVVKAIALGAKAVGIGRLQCLGWAAAG